ncbi:hypothetical protein ACHAXR_012202, partial [Thalassiosira sp. AJA248-18]
TTLALASKLTPLAKKYPNNYSSGDNHYFSQSVVSIHARGQLVSLPKGSNKMNPSHLVSDHLVRIAILGCGMMGQEHISYINKYSNLAIRFLCDPAKSSTDIALSMIESVDTGGNTEIPRVFFEEKHLLEHIDEIDLLVIASPNHMHTPQLLRWGQYDITILVEKPVAVSEKQVAALKAAYLKAKIWVAMEYRFIPAINKLLQVLPDVGHIKKVTIRENRYPFLSKVEEWNKDVNKSGDTLVEKCCHFFDLFRLITGQEMDSCVSKVHRGLLWDHYGYQYHEDKGVVPIIDSAYVLLDFTPRENDMMGNTVESEEVMRKHTAQQSTIGCLELCMFAEGSRHQEEIIVTGMKGRVEAYLPENKVFLYQRPTPEGLWKDKSKPPPQESFSEEIFDCSDLRQVYDFANDIPNMHSGYHYCSTAIEWKYLIDAIKDSKQGNPFIPQVSLDDGIKAVEMGIESMKNISTRGESGPKSSVKAHSSKSSENLLNHDLTVNRSGVTTEFMEVSDDCDGEYKGKMQ